MTQEPTGVSNSEKKLCIVCGDLAVVRETHPKPYGDGEIHYFCYNHHMDEATCSIDEMKKGITRFDKNPKALK